MSYTELKNIPALLVLIDFEKAFRPFLTRRKGHYLLKLLYLLLKLKIRINCGYDLSVKCVSKD